MYRTGSKLGNSQRRDLAPCPLMSRVLVSGSCCRLAQHEMSHLTLSNHRFSFPTVCSTVSSCPAISMPSSLLLVALRAVWSGRGHEIGGDVMCHVRETRIFVRNPRADAPLGTGLIVFTTRNIADEVPSLLSPNEALQCRYPSTTTLPGHTRRP